MHVLLRDLPNENHGKQERLIIEISKTRTLYHSDQSEPYAALDLGSNSFHLVVARDLNGEVQVIDRHREMVRLAEGLDVTGHLSAAAIERALACLHRISQRLRPLPHHNVHVVGTNALRQAENSDMFIEQAEGVLGHKVEVISGREEARLIYSAVSHAIENQEESRLVIDIGGGSTELIVGQHHETRLTESLRIGCISLTERWFSDQRIAKSKYSNAIEDVRRELEVIESPYRKHGWDRVVGTSGTVQAIDTAIATFSVEGINVHTLTALQKKLCQLGRIDAIPSAWCSNDRAMSLPGGLAILQGVFDSLDIEQLEVSPWAMREGLLHDLLDRAHHEDRRELSVQSLISRFHIDRRHAEIVAATATNLFDLLFEAPNEDQEDERSLLRWAALLHEIGMHVSHAAYHRHGDYLLQHMDLPGFSLTEQKQLGRLVLGHRRSLPPINNMPHGQSLNHLCVLLRIAVLLRRNRANDALPELKLILTGDELRMSVEEEWLKHHPLTKLDLVEEESRYKHFPLKLKSDSFNGTQSGGSTF